LICWSVQDVLAADELDDPLPGLHRFGGELGRALVPDDRVERRDGSDAVLDVALEDVRVRRDPSTQCFRSVRAALISSVWPSNTTAAITGSNALSWSWPPRRSS
jgi:hypothetical protein